MAVLLGFFGVCSGIAFLVYLLMLVVDKSTERNIPLLCLFFVGFFLILVPYINSKVIEIKHHSLISTEFGNAAYSVPVSIEYDTYTYKWWTYKYINDATVKHNLKIIVPQNTIQTNEQ